MKHYMSKGEITLSKMVRSKFFNDMWFYTNFCDGRIDRM